MATRYIIISLTHGSSQEPVFWSANNAGYTYSPFEAGKYAEEDIAADPGYYNNGVNTVAVPLTDEAMHRIGFRCSYDESGLNEDQLRATHKHFLTQAKQAV